MFFILVVTRFQIDDGGDGDGDSGGDGNGGGHGHCNESISEWVTTTFLCSVIPIEVSGSQGCMSHL